MSKEHETVGWTFQAWDGGHYVCTHYLPKTGFVMRCVKAPNPMLGGRKVGTIVDISERAIGRTYHRIDSEPTQHDKRCLCYICRREIARNP
jgi:hypothetical protein